MRTAAALLAALALVSAGCDKDKPKTDDQKKVEPTPVPSDLVFNDFISDKGGPAGLKARGDGGLEGGLADVQGNGGGGDDTADTAPGGGPGEPKLKVTDPGADPKVARHYTFTVGKVEKRVFTITQSMTEAVNGQASQPQEVTLKISIDLTPKAVKKEGATIELKITKLEIPNIPASAASMLSSVNGLTGQFDVSPQGDVGELSVAANQQMQQNQLVGNVLQALSQGAQLLIAPLPDAPIGTGAKWELPARAGDQDQGAKRFSASDLSDTGGTIVADIEMRVPKHQQRIQQGVTGLVATDGKGKYTYTVKWNGIAPHVEGDLQIAESVEASAGAGQPKQTLARISKAHQVVDVAK